MKKCLLNGLIALLAVGMFSCQSNSTFKRGATNILVITSKESRKSPVAKPFKKALDSVSEKFQAGMDTRKSDDELSLEYLKDFSAVVFSSVNPNTFPASSQNALERYVQAGGGVMLINASSLDPYTWPWMKRLGQKESNTETIVEARQENTDTYFYSKPFEGGQAVLAKLSPEDVAQEDFTPLLEEAMRYLIASNTFSPDNITLPEAPDPSRFTRIVLDDDDVNEPMELAVLPDGKVIFIERRGKMKLYDPRKGESSLLHYFDVCTEGNYEDGLLGLAVDPNFSENHYLYLYYSPPCETTEQYLSRFTMFGTDSIILASEKVMLKVPVQRETCCHSGGSVTFDEQGFLYLSTGDNTSSKESDGFTPIDERPGRGPFDAQKSSSNTHDLRGKILRIKPHPFGHYTIPDGNLFPKDGSEGAPEIYVMGARNPFRISVDDKTGFVYWGDVGPDVAEDGKFGPQSYDEWNQARTPGFYGWPYFIGNNKPYFDRNFVGDKIGAPFDPMQVINNSPNNTGAQQLPEARGAYIWYPKAPSTDFPMLGAGSNSAMAGPIYYQKASYKGSNVKFPKYFEGKLFIYEWARSWIKVVSMDEDGDLMKIEEFLPEEKFVKPIEMEFGPDGAMYVLEYGQNYFMNNPRARLSRIEYANGNRLPVPAVSASQQVGALPLTVDFSADGSFDYDEDDTLRYEWFFTDSTVVQATGKNASFTFDQAGVYKVRMKAIDMAGESESIWTTIKAGNQAPSIDISLNGNADFYLGNDALTYEVSVSDPEDEAGNGINRDKLNIQFAYVSDGNDLDVVLGDPDLNNLSKLAYLRGKQLVANSDCSSCHAKKLKSVGPSYEMVAAKYANDPKAVEYLAGKIISGGNGVWGEKIMAGHPQHSMEETREMAKYILSLSESAQKSLSPKGSIRTTQHAEGETGAYLLAATYADGGANGIESLQGREKIVLRHPRIYVEESDESVNYTKRMDGIDRDNLVYGLRDKGYLTYLQTDLTNISTFTFKLKPSATGSFSIRTGSADGPEIGKLSFSNTGRWAEKTTRIKSITGKQDVYIVAQANGSSDQPLAQIDWISFQK